MSLLNKIKTKSKFEIFLIFAIFASLSILICSCLKYIFFGSVNFDEPLDKLGLYQHVEFAGDILKGQKRDYQTMFANIELYGIGLKLIYAGPMLILKNFFGQGDNSLLLYISLRGFALFIFIFTGAVLYFTSNFYQKNKSKILTIIFFTFPLLADASYLNIKDIPFAICFTFYSLCNGIIVLSFQKNEEKKLNNQNKNIKKIFKFSNNKFLYLISFLMAALLINNKASMIAPVIIFEVCLAIYVNKRSNYFYKNFIGIIKKFVTRLISILGITYLITPAGWLEPFRYYKEVITAFSTFPGNWQGRIVGVELTTNKESWSLFEYLWRWFQIKIPIIMMLLVFAFIGLFFYKLILKKGITKNEPILNPILIFYGLQLVVTPLIAILANSPSYNSLRHWSFIYPPLVIFSAFIVDNYLINTKNKKFNLISKLFVGIFTVLGAVDNIFMMPYGNISFNTYGRKIVDVDNTDIDYWGYTAGELLKKKVNNGYQVRSKQAPFLTGTGHTPHHIKNKNHQYPYAYGTMNPLEMKKIDEQCKDVQTVHRNLLFREKPLIMSKIGVCPIHEGDEWQIWSTSQGKVEVIFKEDMSSIQLPLGTNVFGLKRIKEEKNKNQKSLSMVFLDKGQFLIEKIYYSKSNLKNKTFKIPKNEEITNYLDNFSKPKTLLGVINHSSIREWELGFNDEKLEPKLIYKDEAIEIISLKKQFVGVLCKRERNRPHRIILKDKSGELIVKGISNLDAINDKNIKPGIFHISKVDCIFDKKDNVEKIFVYETNKFTTYRWEMGLDGVLIESKQL